MIGVDEVVPPPRWLTLPASDRFDRDLGSGDLELEQLVFSTPLDAERYFGSFGPGDLPHRTVKRPGGGIAVVDLGDDIAGLDPRAPGAGVPSSGLTTISRSSRREIWMPTPENLPWVLRLNVSLSLGQITDEKSSRVSVVPSVSSKIKTGSGSWMVLSFSAVMRSMKVAASKKFSGRLRPSRPVAQFFQAMLKSCAFLGFAKGIKGGLQVGGLGHDDQVVQRAAQQRAVALVIDVPACGVRQCLAEHRAADALELVFPGFFLGGWGGGRCVILAQAFGAVGVELPEAIWGVQA